MCWKEEEEAKQNFLLLGSFCKETPTPRQPREGGRVLPLAELQSALRASWNHADPALTESQRN